MATLEQERHVELVSGTSEKFIITSRMVDATIPAQLPHLNVFVLTIKDRLDAKLDTLARVARISDLTALPQSRDLALASASGTGIEFLSPSMTLIYTTLSEAKTAATAIKDRVNALIEDWTSFGNDFNAPDPDPATYILPSGGTTQVTALIEAYKLAKQTRYATTLLKAEADAELARATAAYTAALLQVNSLEGIVSRTAVTATEMGSAQEYLGLLTSAGNTFSNTVDGYTLYVQDTGELDEPGQAGLDSAIATFNVALEDAETNDHSLSLYVENANAIPTLVTAFYNERVTEKNTASVALATAQANQIAQAQALTSVTATEATTLAAVLAVCPDFDKSSIPFVDDDEP